ncbi:MAG: MotA/TolQ/ExbB proton channel family protein [Gammaproteobacteria bacterium]|nr:MotA/TolQ/ExbB proton channel family protein [Gammaproteobacteria bacterium]
MRNLGLAAAAFLLSSVSTPGLAQGSLQELLNQTRTVRAQEEQLNKSREQSFLQDRNKQSQLLAEAKRAQAAEQQRSERLSAQFDANEKKLTELQTQLDAKAGTLGEMFGVVRQVAGDAASTIHNSLISAQFPEREDFLQKLAQSKALPSIAQLEQLWYEIQREMTETGRVVTFPGEVVTPDGEQTTQAVTRIGSFTAVSDGQFLNYLPESKVLSELSRQPASRYLSTAEDLQEATSGYVRATIDPTRGSLLAVLVQAPGLVEKAQQGGVVGYVIMGLALIGILMAIFRFFVLSAVGAKMSRQKRNIDSPSEDNPLGRVLSVYSKDPNVDTETLELRLDEAVLREIPPLEKGLSALKILAAVGPLLGLLGTVTGMIITFQQIQLFGTGDPKLMAGGISQALTTTVQGLIMAIPMVLLHAFLSSRSKALIQVLEEESAGIIAEHAEKTRA